MKTLKLEERVVEIIEKLKYKNKSQQCNCRGWDNAIDKVLLTLTSKE